MWLCQELWQDESEIMWLTKRYHVKQYGENIWKKLTKYAISGILCMPKLLIVNRQRNVEMQRKVQNLFEKQCMKKLWYEMTKLVLYHRFVFVHFWLLKWKAWFMIHNNFSVSIWELTSEISLRRFYFKIPDFEYWTTLQLLVSLRLLLKWKLACLPTSEFF